MPKACFNYNTEVWEHRHYHLPYIDGDYLILLPLHNPPAKVAPEHRPAMMPIRRSSW
jgi:hypothetical protein